MKRKGLSPLIAAVLLIAFTMAVAAILTAWVSTFTKGQTERAQQFEEQIDCAYSNIENDPNFAAYDSTNQVLRLFLTNTGTGPIDIKESAIWKLGSTSPELPEEITLSRNETVILEGTTKIIYLDVAEYEEPSRIRVSTSCPSKWTTAYRPASGWNAFQHSGQPLANTPSA